MRIVIWHTFFGNKISSKIKPPLRVPHSSIQRWQTLIWFECCLDIEVMWSFNIDLFEKALLHIGHFFPSRTKFPWVISLCTSYSCFFKPSFCVKFALQFEHFFLSISSRNSISSFNMALMNRCNMQFHSFTLIKVLITNCTPEWLLLIMRCWNVSF